MEGCLAILYAGQESVPVGKVTIIGHPSRAPAIITWKGRTFVFWGHISSGSRYVEEKRVHNAGNWLDIADIPDTTDEDGETVLCVVKGAGYRGEDAVAFGTMYPQRQRPDGTYRAAYVKPQGYMGFTVTKWQRVPKP